MRRRLKQPDAARANQGRVFLSTCCEHTEAQSVLSAAWTQVSDGTHDRRRLPVGGLLCSDGSDTRGGEGLCEAVVI